MTSWMRREIDEIPTAVTRVLAAQAASIAPIAAAARRRDPRFAIVCGRGSSGHCATFLRYLLGTQAGLIAAEASPSIVTVYGRTLALEGALFLLLSQSGRSPDLVAMAKAARDAGAFTVALVNDPDSPAALACETVIPILAGREQSVAATKTVVNTMVAAALFVAHLVDDAALHAGLARLPARLARAVALDWQLWRLALANASVSYVLARGASFAVAHEIALKLAETAALPSLAYSTAEFWHGPRAALTTGMPVLALRQNDETGADTDDLVARLTRDGLDIASVGGPGGTLPWIGDDHPACDAIAMLTAAYGAIEAAARARGRDPDSPPGLTKVTETR